VLDHYLEVLVRKPGALMNATALVAARASGSFTTTHQRFWDRARRQLGDSGGTKALIEVLLLHRSVPAADVTAGMERALGAGKCRPGRGGHRGPPGHGRDSRTGGAHRDVGPFRPASSTLDGYDGLLEAR